MKKLQKKKSQKAAQTDDRVTKKSPLKTLQPKNKIPVTPFQLLYSDSDHSADISESDSSSIFENKKSDNTSKKNKTSSNKTEGTSEAVVNKETKSKSKIKSTSKNESKSTLLTIKRPDNKQGNTTLKISKENIGSLSSDDENSCDY